MVPISSPVYLLPGLDGTGDLFEPLLRVAPKGRQIRPFGYPTQEALGYEQLVEWVAPCLPNEPLFLIAESFSGPLGVLLVEKCPSIAALVLCATFVEPPVPEMLSRIPRLILGRRPPIPLISHFLAGGDLHLARAVRASLEKVNETVVASRIASLLAFDCHQAFQALTKPVMYLHATEDRLLPRRAVRRIQQLNSSVRLVEIPGPHLLLQAKPLECWRHIQPFLASAATPYTD